MASNGRWAAHWSPVIPVSSLFGRQQVRVVPACLPRRFGESDLQTLKPRHEVVVVAVEEGAAGLGLTASRHTISSVGGSVTGSQRRYANSYLTTSGYGTTSAGRCSTAERTSRPWPGWP